MRKSRLFYLLFAWLVFQLPALYAQTFPVQVSTAVRPPYSLSLADYANPSYDRIQANIYMADLTQVNYKALLRLVIRGPGGIEISTKPGKELGPFFLNGGVTEILTGADLNELFRTENLNFIGLTLQEYQRNAALPEGVYQFHFEVRDFNNPQVAVSTANVGFATAWLILNDPPIINTPRNGATISPQPVQNIFFQWTPRHTGSPNSAFTTAYKLEIVEIYPIDRNANDAMLTSPPIFETTTFATAYNYSITDPNLVPGRWYAFRVKAEDMEGRDFFKNKGYSEVYKFYYGQECFTPTLKTEQLGANSLRLYWEASDNHSFFRLRYRPKGEEKEVVKKGLFSRKEKTVTKNVTYPWVTVNAIDDQYLFADIDLSKSYEFEVQGLCQNNESGWSPTALFTAPELMQDGKCVPPMEDGFTATLTNQGTVMQWDQWPQFIYYDLQYKEVGAQEWHTVSTAANKTTEPTLSPEKVYEYQLTYTCESGKVKGAIGTFTVTVSPDYRPEIKEGTGWCFAPDAIRSEVLTDSTVMIRWEKEPEVKQYEITYRPVDGSQHWASTPLTNKPEQLLTKLLPNTDYEFRLRSVCAAGGFSDYSDKYFFSTETPYTYSGDCLAPKDNMALPLSGFMARVHWTGHKHHTGYTIEVKLQGTDAWHAFTGTDTVKTINELVPATTYDYRLAASCGLAYSPFTPIATFTTLPAEQVAPGEYVCGAENNIQIENKNPLPILNIGDKITAADFELEVVSLNSGVPYHGAAKVKIPYFNNAMVTLQMVNVEVNTDYQLYGGYLYMLSADVIFYEMPPSVRLAQALTLLYSISGDYLNNLDKLDRVISELMKALEGLPDVQQALNDVLLQIKGKLSEAKEAKNKGEKEKGETLAKEVAQMLGNVLEDAIEAVAAAPEAIAQALTNIKDWVREVLEELKDEKEKEKQRLDSERTSLWAKVEAFFDDIFTYEGSGEIIKEDVKRVKTKSLEQAFTSEEYQRFKADPNWAKWNNLMSAYYRADIGYEDAVKFFNYAEVFLFPNNVPKLVTKVEQDLGNTLKDLGKDILKGNDVEVAAKAAIKALLIKNINELVDETPTTNVMDQVDAFFKRIEFDSDQLKY